MTARWVSRWGGGGGLVVSPATKWWLIFRVGAAPSARSEISAAERTIAGSESLVFGVQSGRHRSAKSQRFCPPWRPATISCPVRRSEEHTSELQSQSNLVCRLLLEKKKKTPTH